MGDTCPGKAPRGVAGQVSRMRRGFHPRADGVFCNWKLSSHRSPTPQEAARLVEQIEAARAKARGPPQGAVAPKRRRMVGKAAVSLLLMDDARHAMADASAAPAPPVFGSKPGRAWRSTSLDRLAFSLRRQRCWGRKLLANGKTVLLQPLTRTQTAPSLCCFVRFLDVCARPLGPICVPSAPGPF